MRIGFCASCGTPLEAAWDRLVVVCPSCGGHNLPDGAVPASVPVDERPRVNLGGRTYVLEGQLAEGDCATVYRARWVSRLGERVLIKVLASRADADLHRREWDVLSALAASTAQGAEHYVTRLPPPIAYGLVPSAAGEPARPAAAYGWRSGFQVTLEQVGREVGSLSGHAQVWLLKRLLELLSFVHRAGFVHGAVTPDHVLVHPRDHGAMLVGWTVATAVGGRLPAVPARWAPMYDGARQATTALDVQMACRCVAAAGPWRPAALVAGMAGRRDDAWALREEITRASAADFGPPAWHPLVLPGWG